jgi:hypothetical protein
MSFFDKTVNISASTDDVWRLLEALTAKQKVLMSKPNTMLLTSDEEFGYLYVLRETAEGGIKLRHLVDTYTHVKEAFRTARGQEALKILLQPTTVLDESTTFFAEQEAEERLQEIAQKFTPKSKADQPSLRGFLSDKPRQTSDSFQAASQIPDADEGKFKAGTPWNPLTVSSYMFFATTFGAGIGLGINWRRLGKPEWMWWTILGAFAIPFSTIGILLAMVGRVTLPPLAGIALAMLGFGLNFGFIYGVVYLQHGAYKKWQAVGHTDALKAHRYDFINASLVTLGIATLAVVGGTALGYYQSIPNQFNGEHISFTYPKNWAQYPASDYGDFCEDNGCEVIISDSRYRFTHMLFERILLNRPQTAQAFASNSWEYFSTEFDVIFVDERIITIDGHETVIFEYQHLQPDDDPLHVMRVYIADGDVMWAITAYAHNTPIFNEDRQAIENILNSIQFTIANPS